MENIPVYVKVDRYRELIALLKKLDTKLGTVNTMIDDINKLKSQEDAQIKEWSSNLEDIQSRLERINDSFHGDQ